MTDRVEMLEATLDLVGGGIAILDDQSNVIFWNNAATALTGYRAQDVISRPCPQHLYSVDEEHRGRVTSGTVLSHQNAPKHLSGLPFYAPIACLEDPIEDSEENCNTLQCPTLVSLTHRLGHSVPGMLRKASLHNSLGELAGTALLFYPVDEVDTLPHGEFGEGADIERSQAEMEDRLDAAHHQWTTTRMPYGLLWITIDQAQTLRKTHGHEACEAMLRTVEQTLLRQMKPAEIIGRWGNNEFLVLAHERTPDLLIEHAQRLAGLARTADFRWWGDRVGLTLSIGTSHASERETLQELLSRARQAMHSSAYAGGNQVTNSRNA
jgi:diguanylate cyclase (GGDEF)-like protein